MLLLLLGQAEAIAKSIECCMLLKVPTISVVIGEGGSGGAIALASSNKVLMLENAIYSVISPEGCATILWRDPKKTLEAAKAMKLHCFSCFKCFFWIPPKYSGATFWRNYRINCIFEHKHFI